MNTVSSHRKNVLSFFLFYCHWDRTICIALDLKRRKKYIESSLEVKVEIGIEAKTTDDKYKRNVENNKPSYHR